MTNCAELGNEWQRIDQAWAVEKHEATSVRLKNELAAVERLILETKSVSLPDAGVKAHLAAWWLGDTVAEAMRGTLFEIAANFCKGEFRLDDLITLRHITETLSTSAVKSIAWRETS